MEGTPRLQPARRRRGAEGVETQPGELGTGTSDATGLRASGNARGDPAKQEIAKLSRNNQHEISHNEQL